MLLDELTDDLDVEIDTRPANQRARPTWQAEAEDEAEDIQDEEEGDDENDRDYAPGRRISSRVAKMPKRAVQAVQRRQQKKKSGGESSDEAKESRSEEEDDFESDEEAPHATAAEGEGGDGAEGDDGADDSEDEELVLERPSKRAVSSSGVVGIRAAKKKVVGTTTLLEASTEAQDVDKILTWRWAQATRAVVGEAGPSETPAAQADSVRLREFYVKWTGRSYHRCSWVEEARLRRLAEVKLRYFLKIREMSVRVGRRRWGGERGGGMGGGRVLSASGRILGLSVCLRGRRPER